MSGDRRERPATEVRSECAIEYMYGESASVTSLCRGPEALLARACSIVASCDSRCQIAKRPVCAAVGVVRAQAPGWNLEWCPVPRSLSRLPPVPVLRGIALEPSPGGPRAIQGITGYTCHFCCFSIFRKSWPLCLTVDSVCGEERITFRAPFFERERRYTKVRAKNRG
jgi:hypothetical protein